jgi:hypothetical protein
MNTTHPIMTLSETIYADALEFLSRYFSQFDDLQEHDPLTVQDIVHVLGYASFEECYHPDVAYISNTNTLKSLRDQVYNEFYA